MILPFQLASRAPAALAVAEDVSDEASAGGDAEQEEEKESSNLEVVLVDADPRAFELVLSYIYTDSIQPSMAGQDPTGNSTILLMMDVYRQALQVNILLTYITI